MKRQKRTIKSDVYFRAINAFNTHCILYSAHTYLGSGLVTTSDFIVRFCVICCNKKIIMKPSTKIAIIQLTLVTYFPRKS